MRKKTQSLLILLSVLAFLVINPVRAQQYMRINQSDGTVLEIAINEIQKLTFDITTGIQKHPEIVKQLLKLKVFPNPAKEYVMLDYSLHEKGHVMVKIYSLQGLLVERINQGLQPPGVYEYRINTNHLAAGTYICRVQQNNQSVTQKMIVKH
jgi:hypothetical protein